MKKTSQKPKNNLARTLHGQIWTNQRLGTLTGLCHKNHNFRVLGHFKRAHRGLRLKIWEKFKLECRDIYLESPKKLIRPNLNKPATRGFDRTMSQKSQFLGFEPFLEGSCGPQTENFGKIPKTYGDISLESPKNLTQPNLNKPATGECVPTMSQKCSKNADFSHWWPQKWPKITFQAKMTSDT